MEIKEAPRAIRYSAYLEALAQEIKKTRDGERSRLKLLAAGARLLDTTDYRDLLVESVASEAGVAKGTFYIYFKSKDNFLRELATLYVDFELQTYPRLSSRYSDFTNTKIWVSWYERMFAMNAGVLRCVIQMGASDLAMREIWFQRNSKIVDRAMRGWEKRHPAMDGALHRWMMRTAGGMLDQSLFERYGVQPGPGLQEALPFDDLVELHAVMNFRAMYGRNPPLEEFAPSSQARQLLKTLAPV